MLSLCLAPLLAAGLAGTIPNVNGDTSSMAGPIVSIESCNRGLGVFAKAMPNDALYMGGMQYGFSKEWQGYRFTAAPQFGWSATRNQRALPSDQQFMVGFEVGVCYHRACSKLGATHLSNGRSLGLCNSADCRPNIGVNFISATIGIELDFWK